MHVAIPIRCLTAAVLVLALTACDATPRQRWARQREALTATQDGLVFLHRRGEVSDVAMQLATPWLHAARAENWKAWFALDAERTQVTQHLDHTRDLLRRARAFARPNSKPHTESP